MRRSYESFCKRLNGPLCCYFELCLYNFSLLSSQSSRKHQTKGNWVRQKNRTNEKSVRGNMIRRLFYASLKLAIHIKSLRVKTVSIPWQYFIPCYNSGTKLCRKKAFRNILNWIIPFCWKCQLKVMY